jgi:DNA-binding MarR family transcriptional regulator
MQKAAEIHRLIDFSEILQNLHPVQVTILKFLIQNKGETKKEIAEHLQVDMKTAAYHLTELRRRGIVNSGRDVEPCALLLEYIVEETLHKNGKFSELGGITHINLMKNFNRFSSRWTYCQIKKLCRYGYVHAEWKYTKDNEPYDPYYTVTPEGLSYIKGISPVDPDFVPRWYPTNRVVETIICEGESVPGANFYNMFKKMIEHLSHSQEQALALLLLYRKTGVTKDEILECINKGQVRGSVESMLHHFRSLRRKGIAYSLTGHSQKWIILEAIAESQEYIRFEDIREKTGFNPWWIKEKLEELNEYNFIERDESYAFEDYFRCTAEGIRHIRNISPIIRQKGTVWYPTAETLHVVEPQ